MACWPPSWAMPAPRPAALWRPGARSSSPTVTSSPTRLSPTWRTSSRYYVQPWKVPSGQIVSTWEWYHWIGLKKVINHYRFLIFLFLFLNFWKHFKGLSRFVEKWIQPPACSDQGLYGRKPRSCRPNSAPKMRESQQLFFGLKVDGNEKWGGSGRT